MPKPGDWNCPSCGFSNFAARSSCKNCARSPTTTMSTKPGDWNCSSCGFKNFASRSSCKNCGNSKTVAVASTVAGGGGVAVSSKPGDWNCPSCGFGNFASRSNCKNCGNSKTSTTTTVAVASSANTSTSGSVPSSAVSTVSSTTTSSAAATTSQPTQLVSRDWNCGSCGFMNFRSRTVCKNCNTPKTGGSSSQPASTSSAGSATGTTAPVVKPGDWSCKSCGFSNFGSRQACMQCGNPRDDVAPQVSVTTVSPFDTPTYWSQTAVDIPVLMPGDEIVPAVVEVFENCPKATRSGLTIKEIQRIENMSLWHGYRAECDRLRVKWSKRAGGLSGTPRLDRVVAPITLRQGVPMSDDLKINEVYLMHATTADVAKKVIEGGFDPSYSGSSSGANFGQGTYFSDSLEKVSSYASKGGAIIVTRVALGHASNFLPVSSTTRSLRRPPMSALKDAQGNDMECDCVVGHASSQSHKEFIVYRHTKAYPEYVVWLK